MKAPDLHIGIPYKTRTYSAGSKLWREEGKVTAVQNQGSCGSCWAFAGVASTEGHYAIATNDLKKFSEQEFVDCAYTCKINSFISLNLPLLQHVPLSNLLF